MMNVNGLKLEIERLEEWFAVEVRVRELFEIEMELAWFIYLDRMFA
jgi:hypothetical protein